MFVLIGEQNEISGSFIVECLKLASSEEFSLLSSFKIFLFTSEKMTKASSVNLTFVF